MEFSTNKVEESLREIAVNSNNMSNNEVMSEVMSVARRFPDVDISEMYGEILHSI